MIKEEELIQLIDVVYKAVNKSCIGPIEDKDAEGRDFIRTIPVNVFYSLIQNLSPKTGVTMKADMTLKEPPESWQEGGECHH